MSKTRVRKLAQVVPVNSFPSLALRKLSDPIRRVRCCGGVFRNFGSRVFTSEITNPVMAKLRIEAMRVNSAIFTALGLRPPLARRPTNIDDEITTSPELPIVKYWIRYGLFRKAGVVDSSVIRYFSPFIGGGRAD
ncbi:hypothetical protein [Tepidicaulis marinus]|nr:hypothetical protein [Tepidicaulis marinus]